MTIISSTWLRSLLRSNVAILLVGVMVAVLPVAMQAPQLANAAGMTGFSRVAAGDSFTCGVKTDGTVWCWGRNHKKQLGDGTTTTRSRPVQVLGLTGATQIIAGQGFACALKSNGTVACWGDNASGQLGDGTTTGRATPSVIPNLTDVTQISGNYSHVCARLSDSTARCWGWNALNQLGDGTTVNKSSPVAPSGLTDVAQISAGVFHTCARLNDKTVRCWGAGNNGGLGDGNQTYSTSTKTSPTGLSDVVQIASGGGWNNQCALLSTGVLKCWGLNNNGQVGNGVVLTGSTILQLTPATAGPFPAAISSVDFGMYQACAVLLDQSQSAVCWGLNNEGTLGDGTRVDKSAPTLVTGLTGVNQISTNYYHSCAVLSDTTVKCWGRNMYGELGNGTTVSSLTAVSVPAFLDIPTPVVAAATVSASKSIDVSWGAVTNKTSYTVRLYDVAGTNVLATKAGITTTSTTITSAEYASIADNTNYKVTVTAIGDGTVYINSDESAKVSVTASATPNIADQPVAASRTFGQSVTFSVAASVTDGGTLSYQWLKNGVSILDKTLSSYTISPLATTDAGSFSVRVTNTVTGKVAAFTTSSVVALTVANALTIETPTTGLSGTANSSFSIAVPGVGGRATLSYALTPTSVNGLSINASTGTISGTPTVAGTSTVSVTVTDANGATASTSDFTISIGYLSTSVSLELASGSPQYRTTKRITATTSRAGSVNFMLDGTTITGCGAVAAASTTAVCDWVPVDLGAAALSAVFTPTASTAYSNSTASLSATVGGRAITVTPTASQSKLFGDSNPVIQYSITSGSLYGLDTLTGSLSRSAGEDVGTYVITVGSLSNANYAITLTSVNFTIRDAGSPTISSQPVSANRTSGQSVTFSVSATSPDTGTLSYQWRKGGVAVLNETSASYTIDTVSTSDAGSYTVVVTNTINNGVSLSTASTTSSAATLAVATALTIATPTTGLSGTANSSFSLAVPGSGGRASLTYALTGTLIDGLSFDASTGTISGTPTVAGFSIVSVTVTDANGATASASNFTISVGYASTTVSLELAAGSPQYRTTKRITATTSRAGSVKFKLDGTTITGCGAVAAASTTAVCDWVPVALGSAALSADFTPSSPTAYSNSTASLSATVAGRAITVTPTSSQSKVFGASDPVIGYSITAGSLYGQETLTGSLSRVPGEDAGTYSISGGTLSNANYDITLTSVNFSITQGTQATVSLTTTSGVFGTGLTLLASGGSGTGGYSFAVTTIGTAGCSITSGVLNATSPGACTVTATRASSTNYLVASSVATTVNISKALQAAVTLTSTSGTFNTNISLAASGGTGTGGYSYSVSDVGSASCSIVSTTSLTSSGAGSCTVTATRAGDDDYESQSSVGTTVTFAKDSQNALSINDVSGDLNTGITLGTSGGSGTGSVTFTVTSGSASCSITSGVANARNAGTCSLTATKATDSNYLQKQVTSTLTFVKATQSSIQITSTTGTYGTPIELTISGGSGTGSVSYAVSDTGSASCSETGSLLSFTSAGTCKVTVTRDADNVFDARSSASTTITIDRAVQTTLSVSTTTGDLLTGIIVAVTGGGGTGSVSTSVTSGTANCTLTAGLVTARNIGTCSLSISKSGDTNFLSTSGTVTLTFAKATPVLGTVSSPTSSALGTGITLGYTGGTGNGSITYTLVSAGTAGCSITNGVLNATSGGKCTVTITKQGDDTYADQVVTTEFTFIDSSAPSTTTTIARAATTGGVAAVTTTTTTTTTIAIPTTTVAPKKQVLPPALVKTASAAGAATIGGKTTKAKTTRVNNQLVFSAGGFTVTLAGVNADGTIIPLSSDGLLEVKRGDMFRLDAQGFAPNTTVNIWMFSKTFLLATIEVGADGLVKSTLKVPKSVEDGLHHLVMVGLDRSKAEAKFELGMNVGVPTKQWWLSRWLLIIPIAIAIFAGFWLPTTVSRRRKRRLV